MTERVVLAYSGGLDTSVATGWIPDATGTEVVAVAADGMASELAAARDGRVAGERLSR